MATNITPAAAISNHFYPLPERQPSANTVSRARNSDAAFPAFAFDSLLNIGGTSSSSSGFDVQDFVDLSPEAQSLVDFFNGAAGGLTGSSVLDDNEVILTEAQQAQISAIISEFRDAPFTSDTFRAITKKLEAVGLSPEQLAAQSTASPLSLSQLFLRALGALESDGGSSNSFGFDSQAARDSRDAYTRQIFSEWERISTQFHLPVLANFIQPPTFLRRNEDV